MQLNLQQMFKNLKLQTFLGIAGILLLFRLFVPVNGSIILLIISDVLVLLTIASLILFFIESFDSKNINPLSLVMNVGILNVILFCLITFSGSIFNLFFDNITERIQNPGLMLSLAISVYIFIILAGMAYIFLVFKELYFLKQKKNVSVYFNTMAVFIALASFSNIFLKYEELDFIKSTFLIISIILIVINSLKISWIAFIVKKEKISLLILSVVISTLFVVNLSNSKDTGIHGAMLLSFSPLLTKFLQIMMIYGAVYFSILFFTTLFHLPTAEAFDRKAQEVTSLQYFSKLITEVLDFNDLAETVTDIATKVCNAHASWIVLIEGTEMRTIANKNIGFVDADIINKDVFKSGKTKNKFSTFFMSVKKYDDTEKLSENYSSIAIAPLIAHNELKGFLFAAKKNEFIFDEEDKNALDTFSDYASVAMENSRLLEESIEKERLEKELDVAREIQRKILPSKSPAIDNLSISSVFIPAFEVGGDYYDFFELENNKLGFVIADVSGKGIQAAFVMAEIKGIFESLSKMVEAPKEILIRANEILKRAIDRKTFISAAYGVIDGDKKTLKIARAGHCPVILLRNGKVENLRPSGMGLGLNYSARFAETMEEIEIILKNDDLIVLYTDGITEAKNIEMEDFGDNLFEQVLLESIHETSDEIANKVMREITEFTKNNSQHDDITLVILKWNEKFKSNGEQEWQNSTPQLKTTVKLV